MRRFREVMEDSELEKIPPDLAAWGYHRKLVEHELGYSHWVRYGQDLIFWLSRIGLTPNGNFHICARPGREFQPSSRRVFTCVEITAEYLGFERLFALTQVAQLGDYLERLGWSRYELGYTKALGDE